MLVDVYQRCFYLAHATEIAEDSLYNLGILVCLVVVFIPNSTIFELPYLCCGGHFRKQMYSICMCFQDYYYASYVVCFVSVYTISRCLPRRVGIYVIIFIFDLFTTFLLPHDNKG